MKFEVSDRDRVIRLEIAAGDLPGINYRTVIASQVFNMGLFSGQEDQRMVATDELAFQANFAVIAPTDHEPVDDPTSRNRRTSCSTE